MSLTDNSGFSLLKSSLSVYSQNLHVETSDIQKRSDLGK